MCLESPTILGEVDARVHREEVVYLPLGLVLGHELFRCDLDLGLGGTHRVIVLHCVVI